MVHTSYQPHELQQTCMFCRDYLPTPRKQMPLPRGWITEACTRKNKLVVEFDYYPSKAKYHSTRKKKPTTTNTSNGQRQTVQQQRGMKHDTTNHAMQARFRATPQYPSIQIQPRTAHGNKC